LTLGGLFFNDKNSLEIWDVKKMMHSDAGQVQTIASTASPFMLWSLKNLKLEGGDMQIVADERTLLLIGSCSKEEEVSIVF